MKPSEALKQHRTAIRRIIESKHGCNVRVFGSVARGDDTEHSDLDLLIDSASPLSLFDIGEMLYDLEKMLSIKVEILTPADIPAKFRERVLQEALPL